MYIEKVRRRNVIGSCGFFVLLRCFFGDIDGFTIPHWLVPIRLMGHFYAGSYGGVLNLIAAKGNV